MTVATGPDSIQSSGDAKQFASVAALVTAFESGGSCAGRITRRIVTQSAGVMQVKLTGNGTAFDWYFTAGFPEELQCTGFTATGATLAPDATHPISVYF